MKVIMVLCLFLLPLASGSTLMQGNQPVGNIDSYGSAFSNTGTYLGSTDTFGTVIGRDGMVYHEDPIDRWNRENLH